MVIAEECRMKYLQYIVKTKHIFKTRQFNMLCYQYHFVEIIPQSYRFTCTQSSRWIGVGQTVHGQPTVHQEFQVFTRAAVR